MNLYTLIDQVTTRMLYEEGVHTEMIKRQSFNVDTLTNFEKEQIKIELMNYLIFCFLSLFQMLQIPSSKLQEELDQKEIIDFSILIGLFISFYPTDYLKMKQFIDDQTPTPNILIQ